MSMMRLFEVDCCNMQNLLYLVYGKNQGKGRSKNMGKQDRIKMWPFICKQSVSQCFYLAKPLASLLQSDLLCMVALHCYKHLTMYDYFSLWLYILCVCVRVCKTVANIKLLDMFVTLFVSYASNLWTSLSDGPEQNQALLSYLYKHCLHACGL